MLAIQKEMKNEMTQTFPFCAFILCGGIGSRLKSVVSDRPKPMAMVGDRPFLQILIEFLAKKGLKRIVLLTGFMSDHIEDYVAQHQLPDVNIQVSREETPLGTGGAVRNAEKLATNPTLLVNGDTYFEADIAKLYEFHLKTHAEVTLSLCKVPDISRFGSVLLKTDGMIEDFREKSSNLRGAGLINAGFSIISYDLMSKLPESGAFSMEKDIFPSLTSTGLMYGLEQDGVFFDIGTPESYADFTEYVTTPNER